MLVQASGFRVVENFGEEPAHKVAGNSGQIEEGVDLFLRDLVASDRSRATIKTYAFVLCSWLNFLESRGKSWQSASIEELRDYVLFLRTANNPYRSRPRGGFAPPGVNARTGKPYLASGYKPSTINHRLSVIRSFHSFQGHLRESHAFDQILNDKRRNAHHNPMEPWPRRARCLYRQRQPKRVPRAITDELWGEIFDSLQYDRDRAILSLLISSGSRAQELLDMKGKDVDWGRLRVRLLCKGTRAESWVATSAEFFRWLAAYFIQRSPVNPDSPLWVTLRRPERPLAYTALRAIITRVNDKLGTNVSAHDFRHTCAIRLASDPDVSLIDIQTHLRHQHITTTEAYLVASPDEVIKRLQARQADRSKQKMPTPGWEYKAEDLDLLL
ncbi:MAG TPA: tyrosine-type recombinase/integrase [Blastocatellia bacterium]|nr:tyrosine-type recombinase/integrase [Blastocatellia bacterium]